MRVEMYKSQRIEIISERAKSGGWSAAAKLDAKGKGGMSFSTLEYRQPKGYKTQQEAEGAAVNFAKDWIDQNL